MKELNLTSEWDKTFPKSDKVKHSKVTFPKLFMVIPGANHTDLYDQLDIIPFDAITIFFNEYLK